MAIVGSRRILAPVPRVSRTLSHPARWNATAFGGEVPRAVAEDETHIAWQAGGATVTFALAGDGEGTQLAYEGAGPDQSQLKVSLENYLDAVQSEIAGPEEAGADGPILGVAKLAGNAAPGLAIPSVVYGMPLVFWAGAAVFAFIFVMMFSGYL